MPSIVQAKSLLIKMEQSSLLIRLSRNPQLWMLLNTVAAQYWLEILGAAQSHGLHQTAANMCFQKRNCL